ncbi:hypothetical protein PENTCL1PPCAC_15769, partial [Pristionchus entomophagus]
MIRQLRNNFLMDSQEEYNCSLAETEGLPIDWSTRGNPHVFFGMFCISYAFIAIPFYSASARIIWSMRRIHTYKIMFYLALSDIGELFCNSLTFGILLIKGEVYCMDPKLNFLYAIGSKTWFLLLLPFSYAVFSALFTPLFFFDSNTHTVQVNPRISDKYEYKSYFHIVNNVMNPIVIFTLYAIMLVYVMVKFRNLTIQSSIVITIHMTTCIVYEIIQFIEAPEFILYAVQVGWMLVHGLPPVIYMLFNSSVRQALLQLGG